MKPNMQTVAMIKPLGNNVLILPDKQEKKTDSGIYLPEEKRDVPVVGKVIDGGTSNLENRSRVQFKMWAGESVMIAGKKYLLVDIKDIIGIEVKENDKIKTKYLEGGE